MGASSQPVATAASSRLSVVSEAVDGAQASAAAAQPPSQVVVQQAAWLPSPQTAPAQSLQ